MLMADFDEPYFHTIFRSKRSRKTKKKKVAMKLVRLIKAYGTMQ